MLSFFRYIVIFFLFFSFNAYSEVIKKIDISGLKSISRGTVLNYIPFEVNDELKVEDTKLIFDKLNATNLFEKIQVNYSDDILFIALKENPIIKYFEIKGYKNDLVLSESQIDSTLKNFNLTTGNIFNKSNLDKLINEIIAAYKNNAFFKTKINSKISRDDSNRIGIELIIFENTPSRISEFNISGNKYFETDELLDLFEIGEPDFLIINYFTKKDIFDRKKFEAGLEFLKSKYIDAAFLDFKLTKSDVIINEKESNISINIELSEGPRYKLGLVDFSGDLENFPLSLLKSKLSLTKNSIFDRKKIVKGIENVRSLYSDYGFAIASIETSVAKSDKENILDLTVNINKNNMYYINRIEISGNNRTQDDVIRREMIVREGQIYSQKDIDESLKKIRRLGFFSDVSMKTTVKKNTDQIDIFIEVIETKTGELSFGLSHSNSTGPAFSAGIQQSNIFGTGNTFNAKFINSSAVQELSFFFSDPYFTNDGHTLSYGLFDKSTDASNLDISNYNLDETGFTLGYGVPLDLDSKISGNFRLANVDVKCSSTFSSSLYEEAQCNSNDSLDTNFSFKYSKNSLNDFYSPTEGVKSIVSSSISLPLGDFKYYQLEGSHSIYSRLSDKLTLLTEANVQLAQGYNNDDLPFFKRYFGGGSSSVRGFDFNSLGNKYPDGKAKGGELSYLTSTVLITPAKSLGVDNENIRIGAFIDAGSVAEKASSFDLSDIRASTGIGLSWLTPIGPVGFHLAKPIIQKSGDSLETFSFDLGMSF